MLSGEKDNGINVPSNFVDDAPTENNLDKGSDARKQMSSNKIKLNVNEFELLRKKVEGIALLKAREEFLKRKKTILVSESLRKQESSTEKNIRKTSRESSFKLNESMRKQESKVKKLENSKVDTNVREVPTTESSPKVSELRGKKKSVSRKTVSDKDKRRLTLDESSFKDNVSVSKKEMYLKQLEVDSSDKDVRKLSIDEHTNESVSKQLTIFRESQPKPDHDDRKTSIKTSAYKELVKKSKSLSSLQNSYKALQKKLIELNKLVDTKKEVDQEETNLQEFKDILKDDVQISDESKSVSTIPRYQYKVRVSDRVFGNGMIDNFGLTCMVYALKQSKDEQKLLPAFLIRTG